MLCRGCRSRGRMRLADKIERGRTAYDKSDQRTLVNFPVSRTSGAACVSVPIPSPVGVSVSWASDSEQLSPKSPTSARGGRPKPGLPSDCSRTLRPQRSYG